MVSTVGGDPQLRARFHREAQSAAHLNHPNIITVYDFGDEQGTVYIAMELLEGTDLKDLIQSQALTELGEKLSIMEQICEGLAYAHSKDVIHRDLKPANIHVQRSGNVKIMDFGLARLGASEMTRTGIIMGTPHYMSPEQVRGGKVDARSDIFSLGAVFYELLSNHKPFDADSMHSVLFQVLEMEPDPVRKWVPDLPSAAVDLVERALNKDPSSRFAHAGEMRLAVRPIREAWTAERTRDATLSALLDLDVAPPAEQPATNGAAALDLRRVPPAAGAPAAGGPATLSGRSPTSPGSPTILGAVPVPSSRRRAYVVAAAGFLALGAAAYFAVKALRPPPRAGTSESSREAALTEALISTQVELAKRSLQDKDFKGALGQAEKILEFQPNDREAGRIRDAARRALEELERSAAEARAAFAAGDTAGASRALEKVLAVDPNHPVAWELTKELNSRFRNQAEEARQAMRRAQTGAEPAKGRGLSGFTSAAARAREAEADFQRGEFVVATRKFLESRNAFERATREAEHAASRAAPPASVAARAPLPATVAPTLAALPSPPPPPPPAVATLPPATVLPAPATSVPSAAPVIMTTPPPNDEPAIHQLLEDYRRAIETQDISLFGRIKPNLSREEERRLQEAFKGIRSHRVSIRVLAIARPSPATATVHLARRDAVNGHEVAEFEQRLTLARSGQGWVIREIGR